MERWGCQECGEGVVDVQRCNEGVCVPMMYVARDVWVDREERGVSHGVKNLVWQWPKWEEHREMAAEKKWE